MSQVTPTRMIESRVICKQPGRYIGWPTIGKLPSGELLAVFSGDRDAHVDPFGKTQLVRSTDNGQTWSEPETINDTPLDDRDAGLCVCDDGTVVVSWFTSHYTEEAYLRRNLTPADMERWRAQIHSVTDDDIRHWAGLNVHNGRYELGHWTRRSTDGGHTWEEPVRVPPTAPHGPIQLADGRLIFVGPDMHQGRHERKGNLVSAESCDRGTSWAVIGRMAMFPEYVGDAPEGFAYFCEPHVVETTPGHLVVLARHEEIPRATERCILWQFDSDDGGHTWTDPRPLPIWGKPPHLICLRDGRLLATYGHRREPFGERACLSRDGGKTWDYDNEIILCNDAPNGDLGYPASVELDDGTILTVYYQVDKLGEKTCLITTRWKLEG